MTKVEKWRAIVNSSEIDAMRVQPCKSDVHPRSEQARASSVLRWQPSGPSPTQRGVPGQALSGVAGRTSD